MSDPTLNNQTVTQYLLGALPAPEVERLDELSFTSEEFSEILRATEKDLVDAYVHGELSSTALAQFESHYLASPIRREQVEFAKALQVFGAQMADTSAAEVQATSQVSPGQTGWLSVFRFFSVPRPALRWGLGLAALVLLIAGGLLLAQNLRLRQQVVRRDALQEREQELQKQLNDQRTASATSEQELARVRAERERVEEGSRRAEKPQPSPGTAVIASFMLTPQLRGTGQVKTIMIPPGTEQVAMRLELEPNDYANYRVELLDRSTRKVLWRSGKVTARGDKKFLSVSFPAHLLKANSYSLQVSGIPSAGASEPMTDYPFKVAK